MPPLKKKIKYRYGFKKWSDDKTISLRKELGLYPSSPLCAFDLCKHLGIPLFVPDEIEGLSEKHLNNLLGEGNSHWSAASIPVQDKFLIVHNPTHTSARQQSNLMHELAHIICDHKIPEDKTNLGLSGFLRNHDEAQENEAEWFGACLQLPKPALIWALKNKMTENEIAEHFNASKEMVKYRTNISGAKIVVKRMGY